MSETKHTPGPWKPSTDYRLRSIDIVAWNAQGESIAKIKTGMPLGDGEAIANARLIAAAPETRKALIDLCKEVGRLLERNDYIDDPDIVRAYESALASLRKVEGE